MTDALDLRLLVTLVTHVLVTSLQDDEDIYYENSLEFRRGGDGQPRRSRPTQQYYQPPRARD